MVKEKISVNYFSVCYKISSHIIKTIIKTPKSRNPRDINFIKNEVKGDKKN